jgi:glycosyltransferase involved in cell wall biosynthesis
MILKNKPPNLPKYIGRLYSFFNYYIVLTKYNNKLHFNFFKNFCLPYVESYFLWFNKMVDHDPQFFFKKTSSKISLGTQSIFFMPDFGDIPLCNTVQVPIRVDNNWILYASGYIRGFDDILHFAPKTMSFPLQSQIYDLSYLQEFDDLLCICKFAIESNHFSKAERIITFLDSNNSHHSDILKLKGHLEIARGNYKLGFEFLEKAKGLNRHDRELILLQAKSATHYPDFQFLRESCFEYLRLYPDDSEVRKLQTSIQNQKIEGFLSDCIQHLGAPKSYKVTIIVSTYKSEAFIPACLEDLVGQSIASELEIIVIDAASPENEGGIVREYQKSYKNINYFRTKERIGIYEAWNMGVKLAQGKYITPFSTNDSINPRAYEKMSNFLDLNEDVDLVFGDSYLTKTPHRKFTSFQNEEARAVFRSEYNFEYNLLYCTIGPHPMWRKSLHERIGFFDESYERVSDQEFFMRVGRKYKIKHLPFITGVYWEDDNAISADKGSYKELYTMRKHFRGVYSKEIVEESILASFFLEIDDALQSNDLFFARELFKRCGNRLNHINEIQTIKNFIL